MLNQELSDKATELLTSSQDCAKFQELNWNLQWEIESLKEQMQEKQPTALDEGQVVQQLRQQLAFEEQFVSLLEADLQFNDASLRKAKEELEKRDHS